MNQATPNVCIALCVLAQSHIVPRRSDEPGQWTDLLTSIRDVRVRARHGVGPRPCASPRQCLLELRRRLPQSMALHGNHAETKRVSRCRASSTHADLHEFAKFTNSITSSSASPTWLLPTHRTPQTCPQTPAHETPGRTCFRHSDTEPAAYLLNDA